MKPFKRVLLIDDDDIVNSINSVIIKHAKFAHDVEAINSVYEAIAFLGNVDQKSAVPEIIFLDLNLPGQDGWDFIDAFKELEVAKDIKVVMLSSSISNRDKDKADATPEIAAFISKPLSPELLQHIYASYLV